MPDSFVNAWEEKVIIPTYGIGVADKNPMFFEKRIYQGSSGVVYPHAIVDKIYDEKEDKEYKALFLENEYLKIMILPELGGRVQRAYDKTGQRDFVYHNKVIKPALVGLTGPWISGGIEFNWPQHHRPGTFEPVDFSIEQNEDGSKTVWVNEVEKMFHTKGMAGFTLHPGKAYLEIKVKLYNRTPLPQTFLWWANPAVKVNDFYQSVFPPDVNAVFDHGKRDVSAFPIAKGTYYKVDYSPGTDISWYKNIPVPTSYMAINSDYDFVGGYEHDSNAGMLHVADHHVSPGKKQWTWGYSDFGQAWDRNLTDEDGPYIELMTGVYTDNQPDFSWLMPYEEKSFTQYFMPYRELGLVKNATKDLMVSVVKVNKELAVKVFATSIQKENVIKVYREEILFLEEVFDVSPELLYTKCFDVDNNVVDENILIIITDKHGKELLRYEPLRDKQNDLPKPAVAAIEPKDVENNEQLFLTGSHLEQYRHATYSPVPYYEEALKRDPKDVRNNNALGLWYLRKGQVRKSEPYFRRAIETITQRNPNPYDGEPYYNLGLCLKLQGKLDEAYDAFYKSTWNHVCAGSGYFSLTQIDIAKHDYEKGLEHIQLSLDRNASNSKAYVLKAVILEKLNQHGKALMICEEALEKDSFNLAIYFEQYKILKSLQNSRSADESLNKLCQLARGSANNYIEYALDYAAAGLFDDGIELLEMCIGKEESSNYPMVFYYLGWMHHRSGNEILCNKYFAKGANANSDYCFPNRLEDVAVLEMAAAINTDAKAPYYLGNFWYDKRQYDNAISQWELSAGRDNTFPTVLRNLGMACFNKQGNANKALHYYEKAFALNKADARVLMELDQLYKRLNKKPEDRLSFLIEHESVSDQRDDLYLEKISLYNFLGQYDKAHQLIVSRKFHPWEGGEGKVSGQYVYSLVEMAKKCIGSSEFVKAIELLQLAQVYPYNLGEGKLYGAQENDIFYWLGCAYESMSRNDESAKYFKKATEGSSEPSAAMFYNDQPPDKIFYQGLAWKKLGEENTSQPVFQKLNAYGEMHLNDEVKIDYFAVSLPDLLIFDDDLNIRNQVHCYYIMGLGLLGLNKKKEAVINFEKALQKDVMHFGAKAHLQMAKTL